MKLTEGCLNGVYVKHRVCAISTYAQHLHFFFLLYALALLAALAFS